MPVVDRDKYNEYQREWRRQNPHRSAAIKKKHYDQKQEWYRGLKSGPCVDCGNVFHPCVMDFHHKNGRKDAPLISKMTRSALGKENILKEIEKCELLCSNCHRIRTWANKS